MKLEVLAAEFTVCKVAGYKGVDLEHPFTFAGSTDDEKSLVCPADRVPGETLAREDGWRGMRIVGHLDFALIGILARISSALASAGIGLFAVSTFDTDYVFVKAGNLDRALEALAGAGFEIEGNAFRMDHREQEERR